MRFARLLGHVGFFGFFLPIYLAVCVEMVMHIMTLSNLARSQHACRKEKGAKNGALRDSITQWGR